MHHSPLKENSFIRLAIVLAGLALLVGPARAEEPSVTAVLSSSEAMVGEVVQLQIQVKGDRNVSAPEISVDGLGIQSTGRTQSFEMRNFDVSSSVIFTYSIISERTGRFLIPSQTLQVGNKSLRTPELTLNISDSRNRSSQSNPNRAPGAAGAGGFDQRKNTFAELIIPKSTAYVGEMIPVVVRVGFEMQTRVRNVPPELDLSGQGFTKQKMRMSEARQNIGGRTYHVLTYKTAIAAARAGPIEIGPIEIQKPFPVGRENWRRTMASSFQECPPAQQAFS